MFHGLHHVSAPGLHKPDLLHTVYRELFKHMMDWISGFLKKPARLQAFNDTLKALPRNQGFFERNKAYREVTRWQGKEMRNLGRCAWSAHGLPVRIYRAKLPYLNARTSAVGITRDFCQKVMCWTHTPVIVITTTQRIVISL